jgi:hypothetical protein
MGAASNADNDTEKSTTNCHFDAHVQPAGLSCHTEKLIPFWA